jgi:hypothetical protein
MVLGLPAPPTTARVFVLGDVLTVSADVVTPRGFRDGTMRLTLHDQSSPSPDQTPLWDDAVVLTDRADAHRTRPWTVDTTAIGPGRFVLRLTVVDDDRRSAETAVLFEVVAK